MKAVINRIPALFWLAVILMVSVLLRFYQLGHDGYGCPSASGNVRSMLHSWWHFFFVAWNPAGTYMQDKPPVAYWLQTISAYFFGYHGFALMLPQAIAGLISLALLYRLIMQFDGRVALALTSVAVMAVHPVSVLVARSNKVDVHLVMLALGTACLLAEYAKNRSSRYLFFAAITGGLAFNVKGAALAIMMPSLLALLILSSPWKPSFPWRRFVLPATLFVAISLGWIIAVDLTPENRRPRVMNSESNRMSELMLVHNGIARISSSSGFDPASAMKPDGSSGIPIGYFYGGPRGLGRIFGEFPGSMIAFLIPLVAAGIILTLTEAETRRRKINAAFWLPWLILGGLAFSVSRMGSPHYLELISPPLSVMAGMALLHVLTGAGWRRIFASAALAGSAIWLIVRYRQFDVAGPWIFALACVCLLAILVVSISGKMDRYTWLRQWTPRVSVICFLLAPLTLSAVCVMANPTEGVIPGAIFMEMKRRGEGNPAYSSTANRYISGNIDELKPALDYMMAQSPETKYLVAAPMFSTCSAINTYCDRSALPMYNEFVRREEMSPADMAKLVDAGELRYVLIRRARLRTIYPEMRNFLLKGEDVTEQSGIPPEGLWVVLDFEKIQNQAIHSN